jgi:hypothetical protein
LQFDIFELKASIVKSKIFQPSGSPFDGHHISHDLRARIFLGLGLQLQLVERSFVKVFILGLDTAAVRLESIQGKDPSQARHGLDRSNLFVYAYLSRLGTGTDSRHLGDRPIQQQQDPMIRNEMTAVKRGDD